jgi:alkylation response protein AidB-like acyl-CoA dehydrogenase
MNTISTATLSQPLANATALSQIASTMFAMDAILTRKQRQLKMPRPDAYAGSNTLRISTFARKVPGGYVINGQKIWTSRYRQSDMYLLLARTTPYEDGRSTPRIWSSSRGSPCKDHH